MAARAPAAVSTIGRYAVFDELASGGMATVHIARLLGPVGFSRTVAVKRLHPQFAKDPDFADMFVDEARMAARVHHPNVVQTLDVVKSDGEIVLVMDYIHGESLSRLLRASRKAGASVPLPVAVSILSGVLHGLHAAHEATSERGEPLGLVHRDVSPQNVLVGLDGVARVLDFGIAKATGRLHTTRDGQVKGKMAYMAPEQLSGAVSRRTDVYAAGVVLWEVLTGRPLFAGDDEREIMSRVLSAPIERPSTAEPSLPAPLDDLVMRALNREPDKRFESARAMAMALEESAALAAPSEVGAWVESMARDQLAERAALIKAVESAPTEATDPIAAGGAPSPRLRPFVAAAREDPSSIALATRGGSNEPSVHRAWLLGIASALAVGAVAFALARVRSPGPAASVSPAAPSSGSAMPASLPPPPEPPPQETAQVAGMPAPPVTASARTPGAARPSPRPRSAPRPPPPPLPAVTSSASSAAAAAPKPGCDPPFRVGPNGEKIWIPECF